MDPTPHAEAGDATSRRSFAWLATCALALTFVVVVASAFMRHAQAGLSCADWPSCYARADTAGAGGPPHAGVYAARVSHRLAATGVSIVILGVLVFGWMQHGEWKRERRLAVAALALAALLGVLGVATPGARAPAVLLGNLLGGYLLVAVLAALRSVTTAAASVSARSRALAVAALGTVLVQAALGGLIGTQYASLACPALIDCGSWSWERFVAGGAWNAWQAPAVVEGRFAAPDGAAGLHVLHRAWGGVVAILSLVAAVSLPRERAGLATALLVAVGVAAATGVLAVSPKPALAAVVSHNAAAALLVALLATSIATRGPRAAPIG